MGNTLFSQCTCQILFCAKHAEWSANSEVPHTRDHEHRRDTSKSKDGFTNLPSYALVRCSLELCHRPYTGESRVGDFLSEESAYIVPAKAFVEVEDKQALRRDPEFHLLVARFCCEWGKQKASRNLTDQRYLLLNVVS